jgi:hypothetical protein
LQSILNADNSSALILAGVAQAACKQQEIKTISFLIDILVVAPKTFF